MYIIIDIHTPVTTPSLNYKYGEYSGISHSFRRRRALEMASQTDIIIVEVDDEEFELFKPPPKDSALVAGQQKMVTKNVNFDLISAQTNSLSLALRVAYLGVAKFPSLQIKVNRLSFNITKLSDESVRLLQKFERAAISINLSYIAACKYLTKGKIKFALMEFENVFKKSNELQEAVANLANKFGDSANEAEEIFTEVQKEVDVRDSTRGGINTIDKEMVEIEKIIESTNKKLEIAQQREKEALERLESVTRKFVMGIISMVTLQAIFKLSKPDPDLEVYYKCHEDRMQTEKQLHEYRIKFQKKIVEKLEKSTKIAPHEATQFKLEQTTLSALDCCIKGMKHTEATLLSISQFWKQISDINKEFDSKEVKDHLHLIEQEGDFEMYSDTSFREKIKRQQGAWVAIGIASNQCMEAIKTCNQELHIFLGEHYAPDEATDKLKELMGIFTERHKATLHAMEQGGPYSKAIDSK